MSDADRPGRDRLIPNVISGWIAHAVAIVVGFLMPRLINDSVGQESLGIWDLGWSMVSVLTLSGIGFGSATTHFVSFYRALGERHRIAECVSTAFYWQAATLAGLYLLTAVVLYTLPAWIADSLAGAVSDIRWVGALLGLAIVAMMLGDVARGVLLGVHRSDINDAITTVGELTLAVGMVAILLLGGGIRGLAAATLLMKVLETLVRFRYAHRYCPEMALQLSAARWQRSRGIVEFGAKTSLAVLPGILLFQSARILLATTAGPAALAIFSRPITVITQILRLAERFTFVLPSMASGLQGAGLTGEIRRLHQRASKATVLMATPLIVVFGVFGNDIILIWMGPAFVYPGIPWILAIMAVCSADRGVATRVLSGMNAHGRISLICLASSAVAFAGTYAALRPLDPMTCAVLVAVASVAGISIPQWWLSCRRFGIAPFRHLSYVYARPLLANLAFLPGLMLARSSLHDASYWAALAWAAASLAVLAATYHWFAIDKEFYRFIRQRWWERAEA